MSQPADLERVRSQLAPTGKIQAALNLSNFLLNSGRSEQGEWLGVAPDLVRALALALDLDVEFVPYATPAELAADVDAGAWTLALIGADPQRAQRIVFTEPYVEIESTYLVPPGSPLVTAADVDQDGHMVAVFEGSAYELWLRRNLKFAKLVQADSYENSLARFRDENLTALAGLKSKLMDEASTWPGSRVVEEGFMKVQQAIGTQKRNTESLAYLKAFIEQAKSSGMIASWIAKHSAFGLTVPQVN